ncbi:acyltransferase family protein [Granulicella paludicola]|uniref:acyltransferase family protein n=1 Tax=Granulicella paludicola TaxID=474951 RepID=UPI0021E01934|nr:acyltransferase [Granulicella paludicola]
MHASTTRAPSPSRDPALDGLRGLAVLLVFCFHFGGGLSSPNPFVHALGVLVQAGWIGVVLFFALSGFLITGSLFDSLSEPHLLRNFYARRALRTLPLYYFVLLLALIGAVLHGASLHQLQRLTLFAFFLQNLPVIWVRALDNPSPFPLYHLWSLAVEEQFYLIWPLVLLFAAQRSHSPRRGLLQLTLTLFAFTLVFLLAVYGNPWVFPFRHHFDYFLFTQCGALLLGAALALRSRSRGTKTHAELNKWALPALFLGGSLYLIASLLAHTFNSGSPAQFVIGLPGISLASAALILIALRPGSPRILLSTSVLRFVGRIGYGVYLSQLVLQPTIHRLTLTLIPTGHGLLYFAVRFLLALSLTLATAWLSFQLIEKPFLRLKYRFPMHQPLP